jgi:nitrogen fixation NifU-like protein
MYSSGVLEHFAHPRNAGELPDADVRVRVENPVCGDILELFLKVNDGRLHEVRFRAKGCVSAMACGSALSELAKGRLIEDAFSIRKEDVAKAVGGLPSSSGHAAQLAVDGLQTALKKLK